MEPTSRKNILESRITMIFNKSLLIYIEFKSSYSVGVISRNCVNYSLG